MIDLAQVNEIAEKAAASIFTRAKLSRVESAGATSWTGEDSLSVLLVLNLPASVAISGDDAIDAIDRINQDLSAAGDERFAVIRFVTEEELRASADPEE